MDGLIMVGSISSMSLQEFTEGRMWLGLRVIYD
jgi:hypothetical protein